MPSSSPPGRRGLRYGSAFAALFRLIGLGPWALRPRLVLGHQSRAGDAPCPARQQSGPFWAMITGPAAVRPSSYLPVRPRPAAARPLRALRLLRMLYRLADDSLAKSANSSGAR
jgi:hypothetical protein